MDGAHSCVVLTPTLQTSTDMEPLTRLEGIPASRPPEATDSRLRDSVGISPTSPSSEQY
jgi:hypothetical protein